MGSLGSLFGRKEEIVSEETSFEPIRSIAPTPTFAQTAEVDQPAVETVREVVAEPIRSVVQELRVAEPAATPTSTLTAEVTAVAQEAVVAPVQENLAPALVPEPIMTVAEEPVPAAVAEPARSVAREPAQTVVQDLPVAEAPAKGASLEAAPTLSPELSLLRHGQFVEDLTADKDSSTRSGLLLEAQPDATENAPWYIKYVGENASMEGTYTPSQLRVVTPKEIEDMGGNPQALRDRFDTYMAPTIEEATYENVIRRAFDNATHEDVIRQAFDEATKENKLWDGFFQSLGDTMANSDLHHQAYDKAMEPERAARREREAQKAAAEAEAAEAAQKAAAQEPAPVLKTDAVPVLDLTDLVEPPTAEKPPAIKIEQGTAEAQPAAGQPVHQQTSEKNPEVSVNVLAGDESGNEPPKKAPTSPAAIPTGGTYEEWLSGMALAYLHARVKGGQNPMPAIQVLQIVQDSREAVENILNDMLQKPEGVSDADHAKLVAHYQAHSHIHEEENGKTTLRIAELDAGQAQHLLEGGMSHDEPATLAYRKFTLLHALEHENIDHRVSRLGNNPDEIDAALTSLANRVHHVDYDVAGKQLKLAVHLGENKYSTHTASKTQITAGGTAPTELEVTVALAKATGWEDFKIEGKTDEHLLNTAAAFIKAGLALDKPTQAAVAKASKMEYGAFMAKVNPAAKPKPAAAPTLAMAA